MYRQFAAAEAVVFRPTRLGVNEKTRQVALVAGFALLTALGAQVRIPLPFTPVPITLQTFAVLLGALVLGMNRGALSQLVYLGVGVAGAPVFAGAGAGPAALVGPTGGYLVGFVVAAMLVGSLARSLDPKAAGSGWKALAILGAGTLAIYVPGVLWLSWVTGLGLGSAVALGVVPFLPGDGVKAVLAVSIWLRLPQQ